MCHLLPLPPAVECPHPLELEARLEGHRLARAHLDSPFSTKKLKRLPKSFPEVLSTYWARGRGHV